MIAQIDVGQKYEASGFELIGIAYSRTPQSPLLVPTELTASRGSHLRLQSAGLFVDQAPRAFRTHD